MPAFVAMLRGINVGGKTLKMDQLRTTCDRLGFQSARTYIQSGNVVFGWSGNAAKLAETFEAAILEDFGLKCTGRGQHAAMNEVLGSNAFLSESEIDRSKLHVTFLSKRPAKAGLKALAAIESGADRFDAVGGSMRCQRSRKCSQAVEHPPSRRCCQCRRPRETGIRSTSCAKCCPSVKELRKAMTKRRVLLITYHFPRRVRWRCFACSALRVTCLAMIGK